METAAPMKRLSQALLALARRLPRGYWPLLRYAASRDASLQDYALQLRGLSIVLRADLRETVFVPLFRSGLIPHQVGFDLVCRRLIKCGDIVFDIGANVGYTTALISDLVGPTGHVVAIEPSPRAFALLARSFAGVANTTLSRVGVSSRKGELKFYVPSTLDTASTVAIDGCEPIVIEATTLDDLTSIHGLPALVKVDVEGHESDVFQAGPQTFGQSQRPAVIFEALSAEALRQSRAMLTAYAGPAYRFHRIRNDGALVDVDQPGSSDYVALPAWAESRLARINEELAAASSSTIRHSKPPRDRGE